MPSHVLEGSRIASDCLCYRPAAIVLAHGKGGGLKIDFFRSPRLSHFGVPIASIDPAKGPYEVTALKSTWKWSKYGAIRPIFLFVLECVLKIRVAVRDGI